MKKPILIIGGAVLLGALIAMLVFFIRGAKDADQPEIPQSSVQSSQNQTRESRERWQISLKTTPEDTTTTNATATQPVSEIAVSPQPSGEEDRYVSLDFLDDLITQALDHYLPAHSLANTDHNALFTLNAKTLNMHYGLYLTGLSYPRQNMNTARQAILSYVLTPCTLSFLFKIYGEECLARTIEETDTVFKTYPGKEGQEIKKPLSSQQKKEFFSLCAKKMRDTGKIISRIAEVPHFSKKIENYHVLRNELNSAYYAFWGLDQNSTEQEIIDASADTIKKAILALDQNKKNLISSIVNTAHPVMTSDTEILYIAQWIDRRIVNQSVTMETIKTLGTELQKLAQTFEEHAETMS